MPLIPGTRYGPYEIVAPLGAGGMGEVYRARDTRLGRDVALKILPPDVADDPGRRQRFELEARAVAALNHPNIVAIYDVGDGYIVSELIEGESLRGAKPGMRKTLDIATQIAAALACAHDAGIVHRDLKPDNVLLTRDGRAKVLDFGLAKMTTSVAGAGETVTVRTEPGVVMGTVGYMSPEQVRGAAADHRSDIFSLGVILYELLSGARAFQGDTSVEIMTAILKHDPAELPDTVPPAVRQIVAHCVEKDPVNRFQSARDLGFALSQSGTLSTASTPTPALTQAKLSWRLGAGIAAAILAVAAAFFVGRAITPAAVWTGGPLGGPEAAMGPRISPDGRTLAFQALVNNNTQVAVMKPESGNWQVLTHKSGAGYVTQISWSHDGNRLYYDRSADVPIGVYTVPVLGGDEQMLLEDAMAPEALPDGSLLVIKLNAERNLQLYRFWPDTGKLQSYPLDLGSIGGFNGYGSTRAFRDGREAFAVSRLIGSADQKPHLHAVDLASGRARRVHTGIDDVHAVFAPGRDDNEILAAFGIGLIRVVTIPRVGGVPSSPLLTFTERLSFIDMGPDGAIYADQVSGRSNLLRFPAEGGHATTLLASGGAVGSAELMPDGRALATLFRSPHTHLVIVEAGKDLIQPIHTPDDTSNPTTLVGLHDVAFLIGAAPSKTIAVASLATGRISRRIPLDKGVITSLAASPDGATIYAAAGGAIW
ncbi:MAG TPA: protein kinase, partial [Candidatus Solibacter sp.]|nr:protein kinase [Candidatus Solibacter sp.]